MSSLSGLDPIPLGFEVWKGDWKSRIHTRLVKGKLEAQLKSFGKVKNTYTGKIIVCHNGVYRSGVRIPVDIEITPADHQGKNKNGHTMKGIIGDNQSVSYKIVSIDDDIIKGTYKSSNPNDEGTFTLHRTDEKFIDMRPEKTGLGDLIKSIF